MKVAALLLAAGRGERLGADVPKAFVSLSGRSLFERSLSALEASASIDRVVPVVAPDAMSRFAALDLTGVTKLCDAVAGGVERQDSVAAGLGALAADVAWVAVHDAARCLVAVADIDRVVAAARDCGAAILAEPARDSIKRVESGRIVASIPRAECWLAQTPQVFRRDLIERAMEKACAEGLVGTDDAQLVERLGVPVAVVPASAPNLKITLPGDLALAESWLAEASRAAARDDRS